MTILPRIEIRALTGVRGVAALYVVNYHVLWPDWSMFNRHGYLAVDLFFVLSGFVMALSYAHLFADGFSVRKYSVFLVRRLARVYPLYIFATCAYGFATIAGALLRKSCG